MSDPRSRRGHRLATAATLTLAAAGTQASAAGGSPVGEVYDLRLIALTGDAAPGALAGGFTELGRPVINASGQIVFAAFTDGSLVNSGIWMTPTGGDSVLQTVMGDDVPAPGAPAGVRFREFPTINAIIPSIADDGLVDFYGPLDGYGDGSIGVGSFEFDGESLRSAAQTGDPVNGIPGATIGSISNIQTSSAGSLAGLTATLAGDSISAANDQVMLVEWFGGPTPIVHEGASAPGLPGFTWTTYGAGSGNPPQIAPNGLMTFPVRVTDGGDFVDALYQGFPGTFEPLLVTGDEIPGAGPLIGLGSFARHAVNEAGEVVIAAPFDLDGEWGWSIMRLDGRDIDPVAVEGGAGPLGTYGRGGIGAPFQGQPQIAEDGTIVFSAEFLEPADDVDTAVLRQRPGQPAEVVVREGDAAFGYWAGVEIADLNATGSVGNAIDRNGRITMVARVRGPGINQANDLGLWTIETDGTINLVARGQMGITIQPGDTRYIDDIAFWRGAGMSTGRRPAINDRGDVAFLVTFTDDSQAIVHGHLPPSCPLDRNDDGVIDFDDLLIVLASFDQFGPVGSGGDADWDGDTDFEDLLAILAAFGNPCQPF